MPPRASARRYAQAVFQIALERGELDEWSHDLGALASALTDADLLALLDAPHAPAARKLSTINDALGDSARPLALNLLSLLATRDIAGLLPEVADEYARLLDVHRDLERAEIVTAVPMDQAQIASATELLEQVVGKQVVVGNTVDRGILGGLVARVGDRVIDGSARTKLRDMRREIVER